MTFARTISDTLAPCRRMCELWLSPLLDLFIRLYMARIFFTSGRLKLGNLLDGHWETTVALFRDIHPVPGLPAEIAAALGTAGELGLSVLLAIGLLGRFAAAGLFVMTCVIQFAVPEEYGVASAENYYWMMLLSVIAIKGPGRFSLDGLFIKFQGLSGRS
jgi:putative oxidoreductase